jgi:hypothetical protein
MNAVVFDRTGSLVAGSSYNPRLIVWDARTGAVRGESGDAGTAFNSLEFSADGRVVVGTDVNGDCWRCPMPGGHCLPLDEADAKGLPGDSGAPGRGKTGLILSVEQSGDSSVAVADAGSGRPLWRAPAMVADPPELFTHLGWFRVGDEAVFSPPASGWRRAVEEAACGSARGLLLCVGTFGGGLEIWNMDEDRKTASAAVPGVRQTTALADGCVAVTDEGDAQLVTIDGRRMPIGQDTVGSFFDGKEIVLAGESEVRLVGTDGRELSRQAVPTGLTAAAVVEGKLLIGYRSGVIDVRPASAWPEPGLSLERTPSSPATRIIAGPRDTIVAGFRNGFVGVWSALDGKQLASAKLNGIVEHAVLEGTRLYVATGIGDHAVLDLSIFTRPYCEILREVWKEVPIVWENGQAVRREPPKDHPCAQTR